LSRCCKPLTLPPHLHYRLTTPHLPAHLPLPTTPLPACHLHTSPHYLALAPPPPPHCTATPYHLPHPAAVPTTSFLPTSPLPPYQSASDAMDTVHLSAPLLYKVAAPPFLLARDAPHTGTRHFAGSMLVRRIRRRCAALPFCTVHAAFTHATYRCCVMPRCRSRRTMHSAVTATHRHHLVARRARQRSTARRRATSGTL